MISENLELRAQLEQAEQMLCAIRAGEADALVIESGAGPRIYTIEGAEGETNRRRSEILTQVSDAVIAIDTDDRITYMNAAAERMYGIAAPSALGRALSQIFTRRWPDPEEEARAADAIREGRDFRGDCTHITRDGREIEVESTNTALRNGDQTPAGRLAVIRDVTERKRAEKKLMVSEMRYRRLFEAANDGVLILDAGTRMIIDANPFMVSLLGYPHARLIGKELFEIGLLKDEAASQAMFRELQSTGECRYENLPLETRDGKHQDVEVVANLYDENGRPVIQFNIRDITERKRGEEHVRLLLAEVNHRAKNLLAVVQAMARQTGKYGDPASFIERLSDRIDGLALGQDLLVKSQWQGVEVADLVEAQLSHFKDLIGTRVLTAGDHGLTLNMSAAQGIGMALHELATNAAKYGALSNLDGKVRIRWQVDSALAPVFSISWNEEGGPKVAPQARKGFGHIVIGRMAEVAVDGQSETSFLESGLVWTLRAPAANILVSM